MSAGVIKKCLLNYLTTCMFAYVLVCIVIFLSGGVESREVVVQKRMYIATSALCNIGCVLCCSWFVL